MLKHPGSVALFSMAILAILVAGCNSSDSGTSGGATMDDLAGTLDTPEPVAPAEAGTPQSPEHGAANETPSQEPATASEQGAMDQPAPDETPVSENRAVAGRAPIGEGGYFVAIGGARRQIMNRVEDLAWTQGVQHFKATEGRLPRDHEEFMSKIIVPLGIDLGYKEEDQEFLYDPNEGEWGTVYVVAKETPSPQ